MLWRRPLRNRRPASASPFAFFQFPLSLSGSAYYAFWPPPLGMGARRVFEPSVRNWAPVQATGNKRFLTAVVAASVAPCPALPCHPPSFGPPFSAPFSSFKCGGAAGNRPRPRTTRARRRREGGWQGVAFGSASAMGARPASGQSVMYFWEHMRP